jgi:hypothetical protein
MNNGSELNGIAEAKTSKMVFILGMMAFWCNGDNYAAAPLIVEIAGSSPPESILMEWRIWTR